MNEAVEGKWIAVYVCPSCNAEVERSRINGEGISGLIKCPCCQHEGDLNVQVIPDKAQPRG